MMKQTAALAALGTASANLTIDLFTAKNFAKMPTDGLVKSFLQSGNQFLFSASNGLGDVTYEQCDDDVGQFTFDGDNTYNDPAPVVKGSDVSLNLAGIFGDQGTMTNIHIHVDWNGTPLYDEDHNQSTPIVDDFKTSISWNVPSFAPSGDYDVFLYGYGDLSGQSNAKIMCINAKMTL